MTDRLTYCQKCRTRMSPVAWHSHADCKRQTRPPCDRVTKVRLPNGDFAFVKCRYRNGGAKFKCDSGFRVCKAHKRSHVHAEFGSETGVTAKFVAARL